ncbi:hypothetical protein [Pontibacter chitinilyticus]|uniref:hypothetical protein n=1 Tax=Pontibacter chitinilyticus TaxID=2674989 RepID=UPI003219FDAB
MMNNKYFDSKYVVPAIAAILVVYIIIPKYNFTYSKLSPDNTYVTKIEYSSIFSGKYTYLTAGKYNKWAITKALYILFIPGGMVFMKSYFHLLTGI